MGNTDKQVNKDLAHWSQAVAVGELPEMAARMTVEEARSLGFFEEEAVTEEEVKAAQFDNDIAPAEDASRQEPD